MASVYDFEVTTLDGTSGSMREHEGNVLLIVNTASRCGFTPQYGGLQKLHEDYAERGLRVLGFPCNQFRRQEPGAESEIGEFCQRNYGVDFRMHAKIDVNGGDAHPLFRHLKSEAKGILGSEAIKWNFTKFLVDRKGDVVSRYAPNATPESMREDIERLL